MSGETWRKRVSSFSETVFPGISLHEHGLRSEIVSSLPLQMSLYFNFYFFPVWLATTVTMLLTKFECLTSLYKLIAVAVNVAVAGIEVLRIYLGYFGNLTENIPEVAAFWMLSVLLQLPMEIFLIASRQLLLRSIEYTVQGIMIIFLVSQLVIGYFALRLAARHQAKKFHLLRMQKSKKSQVNLGFEADDGK
ncbi:hypothetical protein RUM43_005722 [Polyplax serrata]|uniref:Transmembrane protein 17 n=1 Tax=Polyplax serrata TaxID=468196 RepID=A0AAN8PDX4_POLSC